MTEVAFDLPKVYPPVEPPHQAEGEVRQQHCIMLNGEATPSERERDVFSLYAPMGKKTQLKSDIA